MQTKTQATEGKDPQQTTGESSLDDATCSPILIHFDSRDALLEMLCHRQFGAFPVYDDDPEIGLSDDAKKAVSWLFSQQAQSLTMTEARACILEGFGLKVERELKSFFQTNDQAHLRQPDHDSQKETK